MVEMIMVLSVVPEIDPCKERRKDGCSRILTMCLGVSALCSLISLEY